MEASESRERVGESITCLCVGGTKDHTIAMSQDQVAAITAVGVVGGTAVDQNTETGAEREDDKDIHK